MPSPTEAFDRRNLLTFVALLCGIAAIGAARDDYAPLVGLAIAASVIADTFDGCFARRFGSDPRRHAVGTELDSLSDAVAFALAPPLCASLLLNVDAGPMRFTMWAATFVHAACGIARLASFTATASEEGSQGFIGLPVPVAALIWASALLVQPSAAATTTIIVIAATAMVLPVRIPRPTGVGLVVFALWPIAVAGLHANALWP